MHGEGERGEKIYVAVTCTRIQIAVTWFPDPVLVAEFRIRHYAAELYDSGICIRVHVTATYILFPLSPSPCTSLPPPPL